MVARMNEGGEAAVFDRKRLSYRQQETERDLLKRT